LKGFKKDGKFRPTGSKAKSSLKKTDVRKKQTVGVNEVNSLLRTKKSNDKECSYCGSTEHTDHKLYKEELDKKIEFEQNRFYFSISDYGSGDIATAIEKGIELGLRGDEVADIIRDYHDDTDTPMDDIDIVGEVYEHELQLARNEIDRVLGFDLLNDAKGNTIEVHYNYMASSFDYTQEALDELQEVINKATKEQKKQLLENKVTKVFLEDIEVEV